MPQATPLEPHDFAELKDRINFGVLPDSLVDFLNTTEWHLEALLGDDHCLRVVYPNQLQASRWFSDSWPVIGADFIRPSVPWSKNRAFRR